MACSQWTSKSVRLAAQARTSRRGCCDGSVPGQMSVQPARTVRHRRLTSSAGVVQVKAVELVPRACGNAPSLVRVSLGTRLTWEYSILPKGEAGAAGSAKAAI